MSRFLGDDLLLTTPAGKALYDDIAKNLPIVDYHCHIDPADIASDRIFLNPTSLWLDHDHYKWRLMRANGVEEAYITGDADDFDKFQKWAQTLEKAPGNPLYLWCHMELKTFFGYTGHLKGSNAGEVWNFCMERIGSGMRASELLKATDVRLLCTTDDPASDLSWHRALLRGPKRAYRMLPTFRPDRILAVEAEDYSEYLEKLSAASGIDIDSFDSLRAALDQRMDFFAANGCVISDHGLSQFCFRPWREAEIDRIIRARINGQPVTEEQQHQYRSALMSFLAGVYRERAWVMQLHFGVSRNVNSAMFKALGPDAGFDCIGSGFPRQEAEAFLDRLDSAGALPRTILYSVDPSDVTIIDTLVQCFTEPGAPGKVRHGAAWWFNDNKEGIRGHLASLAAQGLLGTYAGMLTDSRSLLSYVRHDYFRRILCDYLGELVEAGEYPGDHELLENLVKDISYRNCLSYFGFEIEESICSQSIAQGGNHVTD